MLTQLRIDQIVLIASATMHFGSGLTVFTGETGAGKSILLDALGLILGRRAESRLVRHGAQAGNVIATFDPVAPALQTWLKEAGLANHEEAEADPLIIRRRLKADGSSRAYVNDQPVTIKQLRALGEKLVTIHGQHGQRDLREPGRHLAYLDRYGGHEGLCARVAHCYQAWQAAIREHASIQEACERQARDREYLEHQAQELTALDPQPGEEERLAEQRAAGMQAEKTGKVLREASARLEGSPAVAERLQHVQTLLMRHDAVQSAPQGAHAIDSLERALQELAEAESAIAAMLRADSYDEQALERVEERLFALRELARKYRVTPEALPELLAQTQTTLEQLAASSEALAQTEKIVAQSRQDYIAAASALREARARTIPALEAALHAELPPLKMEATRFVVRHEDKPEEQWSASGMDAASFLVATNPGATPAPLGEIASGGELSRFMLALTLVLRGPGCDSQRQGNNATNHAERDTATNDDANNEAQGTTPPMLIFDEIDTGTGGAVADAIGARLARLAAHQQVAVVTHLPQVAARGHTHYYIEKHTHGHQTHTHIRVLSPSERREDLARMLSGATITDEARQAAARLLEPWG